MYNISLDKNWFRNSDPDCLSEQTGFPIAASEFKFKYNQDAPIMQSYPE